MVDSKTLEELRTKLNAEKTQLEQNLSRTENLKAGVDREYETAFPDIERDEEQNADEIELYESNLATDETIKSEIKKIETALAAMDNGTYGKCINCGKDIPLERLQAYPQADSCLDCGA